MNGGLGYILIKCEKEAIKKVYNRVIELKVVIDVYAINGDYDILAKVRAKSATEIPGIVLKIRKIAGVTATKTLTVVNLEA